MRSRDTVRLLLLLAAVGALAPAARAGDGAAPPVAPPAGREARIGILLPADEALARRVSRGAALAADLLREEGGPVRVLERRAKPAWGSEASEVVGLVYDEGVAAVVTAPDRGGSHLAAQVAAKARVPVLACSGASALTRIPLPWVVRAVPDERAVLASLLRAVPPGERDRALAAFVDEGREGARLAEEIVRAAAKAGAGAPAVTACGPSGEGRRAGVEAAAAAGGAALVAAAPKAAAAVLRDLRAAGWKGTALLFPVRDLAGLVGEAGAAAEGALAPRIFDPSAGGPAADLRKAYVERYREEPDEAAAAAFAAVRMAVRAVRSTDGSAEAVRAALLAAPPLDGATGRVILDAAGDRAGPVPLAECRGGRFVPLRASSERTEKRP